ncbi:hypothetical protein [Burkholderia sp. BCC0405]|uniref:hypothetical protein n=1 Tax=Burkholderia sp. BCC0405 TaxID=2676298 RepID=UPI001FC880A4|nr:hypothetical protein [Burkholderia sp. BCC0405]
MPQSPLAAATNVNPAGKFVMGQVDSTGNEFIASGKTGQYNITSITAVKTSPGRVVKVVVNVASSTAVKVYDVATTGGAAAANLIYAGPTTSVVGTIIPLDWPCATGIVVDPGTGGTVSVNYI